MTEDGGVKIPDRTASPQLCHVCDKRQDVGAEVWIPATAETAKDGKMYQREWPVVICTPCKPTIKRAELRRAVIVEERRDEG